MNIYLEIQKCQEKSSRARPLPAVVFLFQWRKGLDKERQERRASAKSRDLPSPPEGWGMDY